MEGGCHRNLSLVCAHTETHTHALSPSNPFPAGVSEKAISGMGNLGQKEGENPKGMITVSLLKGRWGQLWVIQLAEGLRWCFTHQLMHRLNDVSWPGLVSPLASHHCFFPRKKRRL